MSGIQEIIDGVDRSKIFGRVLWDDLNMSQASLRLGASSPDLINVLGAGGIYTLAFDGLATAEEVHGTLDMPHGYLEGSDVKFHVHWMPTTTDAGNVKWQIEYSWVNLGEAFPNPTTTSAVGAAGGTAWSHNEDDFSTISGTGKNIGTAMLFRLFRDPADGEDTYGFDAALIQIGLHIQVDVYGSRTEDAK
jgi:hypothetical protein